MSRSKSRRRDPSWLTMIRYHLRSQNRGRYDSAIKLFEVWNRRTTARAVVLPQLEMEKAFIR